MTELSFSKSFLSTLIARPQRLAPDYAEDPRKLPARNPYTLPHTLPPPPKRARTDAPPSANLTLKPLKPTATLSALTLPDTLLSTTGYALKAKYAGRVGVAPEKVRLVYKGKPVGDVKTLGEVGVEDGAEVVLSVMVLGGAEKKEVVVEEKGWEKVEKGVEVMRAEEFWGELRGWLGERVGEGEAERVLEVWRKASEGL